MAVAPQVKKRAKIFYGWWVVVGASLISVISAINFYGFPEFFPALIETFGWSRAKISLASSVARLQGGIEVR